jgi:hypothetical protein
VQVADTIPSALTFLSATTTRGSYDSGAHLWSVGSLAPNAPADTLRIRARVNGPTGLVVNTARLVPLILQQENTPANNTASGGIIIS